MPAAAMVPVDKFFFAKTCLANLTSHHNWWSSSCVSLPHYFQVLFTLSISIIMVIKLGGFLIITFF